MSVITEEEIEEINGCAFTTAQPVQIENCQVLAHGPTARVLPKLKSYYQTCLVKINDKIVRIVLDSAAGRSVVIERLCNSLNLEEHSQQKLNIGGPFGKSSSSKITKVVTATLKSLVNDQSRTMQFSVVPSLDPLRMAVIPKEAKERLKAKGFELVDAEEENLEDHPVQVIVGVDFYGDVWNGMETRITNDLHVRESIFGWVVFGVTAANPDEAFACINIICTDDEYEAKVPAPSADFNKKLEAKGEMKVY